MRSLVIIDVQYMFKASLESGLIKPILREIALAKKNKYPIIVLEWDSISEKKPTLEYIVNEVKDCARFVKKRKEDGSFEVIKALRGATRSKNIRILGVNTGACVAKTVRSLVEAEYKVEVVGDACWDSYVYAHYKQLDIFCKNKTIRVLHYDNKKRSKEKLNAGIRS